MDVQPESAASAAEPRNRRRVIMMVGPWGADKTGTAAAGGGPGSLFQLDRGGLKIRVARGVAVACPCRVSSDETGTAWVGCWALGA